MRLRASKLTPKFVISKCISKIRNAWWELTESSFRQLKLQSANPRSWLICLVVWVLFTFISSEEWQWVFYYELKQNIQIRKPQLERSLPRHQVINRLKFETITILSLAIQSSSLSSSLYQRSFGKMWSIRDRNNIFVLVLGSISHRQKAKSLNFIEKIACERHSTTSEFERQSVIMKPGRNNRLTL